jgi:phosphate transport system permease protein
MPGVMSRPNLQAPRDLSERAIAVFLFLAGALSILTTAGIIGVLIVETVGFFREVSVFDFLGDTQWTPLFAQKHFGIWPLVAGSALTSLIALITAVPLGLLGAIYLSEFASDRVRRILKPAIELLAGVPTVIYGYFALTFVTPLLQRAIPGLAGFNSLSPGIVMGVMILPIVASLSEDAIYAVPHELREGALALGASRMATIFHVVLPTALSGIGASIILGVSRAVGETMIVAIAAGQQPRLTLDPRVPIETMTAYIVQVSLGDTPAGTLEYRTIFAVGAALFAFTLILNTISQRLRRHLQKGSVR